MKLHNYLAAALLGLCSLSASAYPEVNRYATDETSDLALIYTGSDRRPEWNSENLMPFVVHTYADGTKDWFFDAFLLLEFTSGSTGKGFQNGVAGTYADKNDWLWLMDKQFNTMASLDSAITIGKQQIGNPPLRHKVVLGLPAPIKAQGTAWGEVNGRTLDFANADDRYEACKWYISEIVKRNVAQPFDNLDIVGLYWLEESLFTNGEIMPRVNDWIYRNCFRSYWIPYFADNEQFKFNWKEYGFDVAYQQPNYFFDRSIPMSQLEAACDESKRYGLGLEMEFETQGTSRLQHDDPDSYYTRLEDYIDMFEKKGVFDESAIAWYSGTKGYLDLANSTDAKNHEIADRMARIVAKRGKAKAAAMNTFPVDAVRDAALIWHGADRRIEWNPEQFEPYVAHTFADGSKDWLFDGYIFLEGDLDGKIRFIPWVNYEGATKADWTEYLDRLFAKGVGVDALNTSIENVKADLGNPPFRHKLEIMLPVAVPGNKHWGEIDGRALDFDNDDDRLAAAKWYIDEVISRFNAGGYNNLDLYAIYYLDEDMNLGLTKDYGKLVEPYVHAKGLKYTWIPYFKGRGYERHNEIGFDITYVQPGHYFEWEKPDKRLEEAIDLARRYGMSMEFECDSEALSQFPGSKMSRMQSYIDAFERNGVWDKGSVAWYTGSKAFLDMKNNPSPENQAMMDQVARIIVKRRFNPNLVTTTKR